MGRSCCFMFLFFFCLKDFATFHNIWATSGTRGNQQPRLASDLAPRCQKRGCPPFWRSQKMWSDLWLSKVDPSYCRDALNVKLVAQCRFWFSMLKQTKPKVLSLLLKESSTFLSRVCILSCLKRSFLNPSKMFHLRTSIVDWFIPSGPTGMDPSQTSFFQAQSTTCCREVQRGWKFTTKVRPYGEYYTQSSWVDTICIHLHG